MYVYFLKTLKDLGVMNNNLALIMDTASNEEKNLIEYQFQDVEALALKVTNVCSNVDIQNIQCKTGEFNVF